MQDSEHTQQHSSQEKAGVLLVNLGSPDAPTPSAVKRYLAEFLWDPRVVDTPRLLWWLILHGVILRFRPRLAAHAYKKVWTEQGSPLVVISKQQTQAVKQALQNSSGDFAVELAMRYGQPSISNAIDALNKSGARKFIVLPMYPQFSYTTTASVVDEVTRVLHGWKPSPELHVINDYHDHPKYIRALASSIRKHWDEHSRGEKLLFSFHGIPQRFVDNGDPYFDHCQKTTQLVAKELQLKNNEWQLVFQSRFGREAWLQPYCNKILQQLAKDGIKSVDIICPGFSADCLETLEEISMQNKQLFIEAGGKNFNYIPCLNDNAEHIDTLTEIVTAHTFD